jgi:hypothetical protein
LEFDSGRQAGRACADNNRRLFSQILGYPH